MENKTELEKLSIKIENLDIDAYNAICNKYRRNVVSGSIQVDTFKTPSPHATMTAFCRRWAKDYD